MWRRREEGGLGVVREVCVGVVVARDVEDVLGRHEARGREGGPGMMFRGMPQLPDGNRTKGSVSINRVVAAGVPTGVTVGRVRGAAEVGWLHGY